MGPELEALWLLVDDLLKADSRLSSMICGSPRSIRLVVEQAERLAVCAGLVQSAAQEYADAIRPKGRSPRRRP